MTSLQARLKRLKPNDILVCRDGTRRTFRWYYSESGNIWANETSDPCVWDPKNGRNASQFRYWDIVRVIPARKAKAKKTKVDKDAKWLRLYVDWLDPEIKLKGRKVAGCLRRIATRLEKGMTK